MRNLLKVLGASALIAGGTVPASVQALGGPLINQGVVPVGIGSGACLFTAYMDQGFGDAAMSFNAPTMNITSTGGSEWFGGAVDASVAAITVSDLETQCIFEPGSVVIESQNGADNGSFSADDYMGITFLGRPASDTNTYRYVVALQGASATTVVNTRTLVTLTTYYRDADDDTYGDPAVFLDAVSAPSGYVTDNTDCDDSNAAANPGATEVLDGIDNNCDGNIDEGFANTPPTAVAGAIPNPAASGQTVTLVGSSSSANDTGQSLTYSWSQTAGTTVTLSPNASAANPTFVAPTLTPGGPNETLTFSLVVNDGVENSVADTVDVTVNAPADNTPPTAVSLLRNTPTTTFTNADSLTWALTFDEDVQSVDPTDFTVTGTTATLAVTGTGTTYNLTLSGGNLAGLNGTVTIGFSGSQYIEDLATNPFGGTISGTNESSYSVDNAQDSIALTTPSSTVSGEFPVTAVFTATGPAPAPNAANPGLAVLSQVAITNGTRTGGSSFSGNTLTFNVTPNGSGAVTVSFPAAVASDGAGNPTQASNVVSVTANAAPTATASAAQTSVVSGTQVQLQGTGTDTDGTIASYSWTRTGGTGGTLNALLNSTSAQNPTFTDSSLTSNDVAVTHIFELIVTDDDGAQSVADAVTITITPPADTEAPVIRPITNVSFEADPSGSRLIGFSAIVDDNVDTGIQPVFRLDGNIITSPYAFPTGANLITINATDTAGNPAVEVQFTITITPGVTPDTPQITTADINTNRSLTIGGTAEVDSTVRVTFPDTTFQEVTATGGVYSVTSAADMTGGTVSVTSTDARGYTSPAATVDLFPDYDEPTVTITGAPSRLTEEGPFTITITFSEPVLNFVQGDLTVAGGILTSFSGAGAVYTAEITPETQQNVLISVAAGVAEDAAGNLNVASSVVRVTNRVLTATEQLVTRSAIQRGIAQSNTRPSLRRFFVGRNFTNFNASVTQGAGNFDFETSSGRPVWAAGQGQWSTNGDMETSYANVAVGAHFEPTENVLLGIMAQFDHAVSDQGVARMESTGWLVGPYAVARLEDQPLVFSASYLMGQSENTASPLGTYEDTFTSDRTMATVGVSGELELTRLTLIPLLDVAYITDQNEAYVDGGANVVRSLKATVAEATLGMDFVMPINTVNGSLDLIGGFGATASVTDDSVERIETTRGRTELGFRYGMENGGRLTARATYDGLSQDDYEAYGAEVLFEISF